MLGVQSGAVPGASPGVLKLGERMKKIPSGQKRVWAGTA